MSRFRIRGVDVGIGMPFGNGFQFSDDVWLLTSENQVLECKFLSLPRCVLNFEFQSPHVGIKNWGGSSLLLFIKGRILSSSIPMLGSASQNGHFYFYSFSADFLFPITRVLVLVLGMSKAFGKLEKEELSCRN